MLSVLVKFAFCVFVTLNHLLADECFPKTPMSAFNPPERYANLPGELIDVLRKSYLQHTKENKYLDNTFWGSNPDDKCSWPDSLWTALDTMGPREI
ncbi:MAG TPA: hypothetical protein VNJ08_10945 [Bacteriovoracaceae bacterium]|nr:hypothetical protein [Bacteriovoracaceae bacterium]